MSELLIVSSILLWMVVVLNFLLTLALIRRKNSGPSVMNVPKLKIGQSAPDFTAETLSGETVTQMTYSGRAVAFMFVSPDCGPCRELIPSFEALHPKAQQSGSELVLVSQVDTVKTQSFVAEYGITLPVLVAPREGNSFGRDYKVAGTPFYCFIDAEGKVQGTGFLDSEWENLAEEWEAKAAGRSLPLLQTPTQ